MFTFYVLTGVDFRSQFLDRETSARSSFKCCDDAALH